MSIFKHLTHEQRVLIEDRLNHKISIRAIAKELNKSPSTILREIQNHSMAIPTSSNDCASKRDCHFHHICGDNNCNRKCYACLSLCTRHCENYKKSSCRKLDISPYLCNGCKSINFCVYDKNIYKSTEAQSQYINTLTSSRSGFDVTDEELDIINTLASPLIKNWLSPYHIKQTYQEELIISESTLRRMIDKNILEVRNVDLRDKVKRKPRNKTSHNISPLSATKIGHFYGDYLSYLEENDVSIAEMDCVKGKKDEDATLLTLTIPSLSFQLAFIMDNQTTEAVVKTLNKIETSLGYELFNQIFPVILTDNGSEFADIPGMEASCVTEKQRTKIFFCEPNRSDEKGSCENHHKMIRYIIPKGSSLEPYTQADITLMMNHINSYKRKALFGLSAYNLAQNALPDDFFTLLGIEEIPAEKIILRPSLISSQQSNCNIL